MDANDFNKIIENNPLYKHFFATFAKDMGFMTYVEPTQWRGKDSEHSLSFKDDDAIKELFGVEVNDLSNRLDKRFLTIHSSALLALLFFYGISEKNPLCDADDSNIKYTQVFFEVKNKVFDNPSSIDVLLADNDGHNLLFLESKFTEYLSCGKRGNINIEYKDYYEQLNGFWNDPEVGVQWVKEDDNTLCIKGKEEGRTRYYCEGIKQMISHYIDLVNGPSEKEKDKDFYEKYKEYLLNKANSIKLGEIMYCFDEAKFEKYATKFNDYSGLYSKLAEKLNEHARRYHPQIHVIEPVLTYQELANTGYCVSDKIKKFYQL